MAYFANGSEGAVLDAQCDAMIVILQAGVSLPPALRAVADARIRERKGGR